MRSCPPKRPRLALSLPTRGADEDSQHRLDIRNLVFVHPVDDQRTLVIPTLQLVNIITKELECGIWRLKIGEERQILCQFQHLAQRRNLAALDTRQSRLHSRGFRFIPPEPLSDG